MAYIENYPHGALPTEASLDALLHKYPWFTTARIAHMEVSGRRGDAVLDLHFTTYPAPLKTAAAHESATNTEPTVEQQNEIATEGYDDIINTFLCSGEHRIVPRDDTPEFDAAYASSQFDLSDDAATEELAEIYVAQGLIDEAKEIYAKLILLYPEKSVYFAEIIDGIARNEN